MKQIMWTFVGLVMFICVGCVSVQTQTLEGLPQPAQDKGLIFFYREKIHTGSYVSYYVYENGQKMGAMQSGSFFFIEAEPGVHVYATDVKGQRAISLKVEAEQTYYIKGGCGNILEVGAPLSKVHPLEGKAQIPKLKCIKLTKAH